MADAPGEIDPHKAKPLWAIGLLLLIAVPLLYVESLLLREILGGYMRGWPQAAFLGIVLVLLAWSLITNISNWLRRPKGEEAIMQAAEEMARLLPETPVEFRSRSRSDPNRAIYAATPLLFFGLALWGVVQGKGIVLCVGLGMGAFFSLLFWYIYTEQKKIRRGLLIIDPIRKVVVFENFSFETTFLPVKPSLRTEVPFDQIIGCTFFPGHKGGPPTLRVRTAQGPTTISGLMGNFDMIRGFLENQAILNLADPEQHERNLRAEPKIKVPWFGWLLIAGAFAGLGIFVWILLTKL